MNKFGIDAESQVPFMGESSPSSSSTATTIERVLLVVVILAIAVAAAFGTIAGVFYFVDKGNGSIDANDHPWPGQRYSEVHDNDGLPFIEFFSSLFVYGNITVSGRAHLTNPNNTIGGIPAFTRTYAVCDGQSIERGRAVSWYRPPNADPQAPACAVEGFKEIGDQQIGVNPDENSPIISLRRASEDDDGIVMLYLCQDGFICWTFLSGPQIFDGAVRYQSNGVHVVNLGNKYNYTAMATMPTFAAERTDVEDFFFVAYSSPDNVNYVSISQCYYKNGHCQFVDHITDTPSGPPYAGTGTVNDMVFNGRRVDNHLMFTTAYTLDGVTSELKHQRYNPAASDPIAPFTIDLSTVDIDVLNGTMFAPNTGIACENITLLEMPDTSYMMCAYGGQPDGSVYHPVEIAFISIDRGTTLTNTSIVIIDSEVLYTGASTDNGSDIEIELDVLPGTARWVVSVVDMKNNENGLLFYGSASLGGSSHLTIENDEPIAFQPVVGNAASEASRGVGITGLDDKTVLIVHRDIGEQPKYGVVTLVELPAAGSDDSAVLAVSPPFSYNYPSSMTIKRINNDRFMIGFIESRGPNIGASVFMATGNVVHPSDASDVAVSWDSGGGSAPVGIAVNNGLPATSVEVLLDGYFCFTEDDAATRPFLPFQFSSDVYVYARQGLVAIAHPPNAPVGLIARKIGYTISDYCIKVHF